ncbi:MAG: hypothetical protein V4592_23795 [Bacteroidota bacterium]
MEIKQFNEWVLENPGKSINDYYKMTGLVPVTNSQPLHLNNTIEMPSTINVKISAAKLFLYTGVVMVSVIVWTILFFIVFYGIAGEVIKHFLLRLSGQSI